MTKVNKEKGKNNKETNREGVYRFARLVVLFAILATFFSLSVVPSESMYPAIHPKDFVIYNKHANYERGDIVCFESPYGDALYVKRIIAMGGDKISIANGEVKVNGKVINEPYLAEEFDESMGTMIVPEGELFFMGDNRNYSVDSREFGTISEENVKGKLVGIIMPFNRINFKF